jgi:hypothetical protein
MSRGVRRRVSLVAGAAECFEVARGVPGALRVEPVAVVDEHGGLAAALAA